MILIEKNTLETISNHVRCVELKKESGGILLGYRKNEHLHVVQATLPGKFDRSTYDSFFRKDWSHQLLATKEWAQSGFKVDWLGEWHSHPESIPMPSCIDINTWKKQANNRQVLMVYLIIGIETDWVGVMNEGWSDPLQLEIIEETETTCLFDGICT